MGRNVNNLRYAEDTTLMAESEEELKSLLMKVKEELSTFQVQFTFVFCHNCKKAPSCKQALGQIGFLGPSVPKSL